ncbi:hypothetical protein [Aequorivita antarctica]|uniref:Heavy-metal-associated domain-containing protein n=1 Tax=Aequorivita antarctica TaxID=153266 RepID=A0A5C6Z381_9FLAO|nr:hypothetical protein [Aequorivita antarctica]TXD74330.1 hypothetical protein ESU54_03500 [Aequorivita antarctica]SRX73676.1 hypothetical protein AEQU3_01108 [Aequorivita antarctica]
MFELATLEKRTNPFIGQPQVLVFGSNIDSTLKAKVVQEQLAYLSGVVDISVDLEDWEHVLRVECSSETVPELVVAKVLSMGFRCYEL